MRVGYRVMMALLALSTGTCLYFGITAFQGYSLKLNGLSCLVIGVILLGSCFSDLPPKISNRLSLWGLICLEIIQLKLIIISDWASTGIEIVILIASCIFITIILMTNTLHYFKKFASTRTNLKG